MAQTAKLTTGPSVSRTETIREQFSSHLWQRVPAREDGEEVKAFEQDDADDGSLGFKWLGEALTERERNSGAKS